MIILRKARRDGFATLIAIFLLAMVSLALAVLAARMTAEARRTRQAPADAQLRQLLLAGVEAGRAQLAASGGDGAALVSGPVKLPIELSGAELSLQWGVSEQTAELTVRCAMDGRAAAQRANWRWDGQKWSLHSAELAGDS